MLANLLQKVTRYLRADIHRALCWIPLILLPLIFILDMTKLMAHQGIFGHLVLLWSFIFFIFAVRFHTRYPDKTKLFWDRLASLSWPYVLVYFAVPLLLSQVFFSTVFPRRLFFFSCYIHLVPILWPAFRDIWKSAQSRDRLSLSLFAILCLVLLIPGFYFPPFFNGIAGWSAVMSRTAPADLVDYKFIRDDGAEIWISPAMSSPSTFNWRHIGRAQARSQEDLGTYLQFLFTQYQRYYPLLAQGKSINNRYLGSYAYPGHNPYRNYDYSGFPPERIRAIAYVTEIYERPSLKPVSHTIEYQYDPHAQRFLDE